MRGGPKWGPRQDAAHEWALCYLLKKVIRDVEPSNRGKSEYIPLIRNDKALKPFILEHGTCLLCAIFNANYPGYKTQ